MTHPALIERITRSLAYMLRHQPEEFDLELDAQGYGDAERIVQALNERLGEPVTMADLEDAISSGDRPRYEILGNRVRALYGHSIDVEPGEPTRPQELLFVGISARDADRAMRYGLRGGRRRFLHLALTPEDAKEGGRRTGRDYVVITVYALDAWEEGINFYDRKALFLAGQIPTEFLEISETCHDGFEPEMRSSGGRREFSSARNRPGSGRVSQGESRAPREQPMKEPSGAQGYEEEGFGEGTPEAIQVDRDRSAEREVLSPEGFSRGGGHGRADRGVHPGGRQRPGRERRAELQPNGPNVNDLARTPEAAGRRSGWDGPQAGGSPDSRESRPFRSERQPDPMRAAPAQDRGAGEPGAARPLREPAGEPNVEQRGFDRGQRGDRGSRSHERGEQRQNRPGTREERGPRGFERGDRGARSDRPERSDRPDREGSAVPRQVPPPAPSAPPRAPEPPTLPPARTEEPHGFGLGIYEEPAVRERPAPPPPRPVAPPAPAPAPRESDPADGFGAGV